MCGAVAAFAWARRFVARACAGQRGRPRCCVRRPLLLIYRHGTRGPHVQHAEPRSRNRLRGRCGKVSTYGWTSLWCSADTRCPSCIPGAVSTPWLALVQPHTTLRLLGNGDGRRGTLRSWRKVVVGDPGASARLLGGGCRQWRACRGHLQAAREHACQDHPLRTQVWALCHALKCRAHALFHLTRSGARCDAARNVRTASAGG